MAAVECWVSSWNCDLKGLCWRLMVRACVEGVLRYIPFLCKSFCWLYLAVSLLLLNTLKTTAIHFLYAPRWSWQKKLSQYLHHPLNPLSSNTFKFQDTSLKRHMFQFFRHENKLNLMWPGWHEGCQRKRSRKRCSLGTFGEVSGSLWLLFEVFKACISPQRKQCPAFHRDHSHQNLFDISFNQHFRNVWLRDSCET